MEDENLTYHILGYTKEEWDAMSDTDKAIAEEKYYKKY